MLGHFLINSGKSTSANFLRNSFSNNESIREMLISMETLEESLHLHTVTITLVGVI